MRQRRFIVQLTHAISCTIYCQYVFFFLPVVADVVADRGSQPASGPAHVSTPMRMCRCVADRQHRNTNEDRPPPPTTACCQNFPHAYAYLIRYARHTHARKNPASVLTLTCQFIVKSHVMFSLSSCAQDARRCVHVVDRCSACVRARVRADIELASEREGVGPQIGPSIFHHTIYARRETFPAQRTEPDPMCVVSAFLLHARASERNKFTHSLPLPAASTLSIPVSSSPPPPVEYDVDMFEHFCVLQHFAAVAEQIKACGRVLSFFFSRLRLRIFY